jgi:uncharacterized protein YdaU (DUF1376 family)
MKYQFMPMFWGDFFANTLHLSAQEVGAYVLLIAHAWENEGRVPYSRLQRIARVNPYHWQRVWKQLEPFFEIDTSVGTPQWVAHRRVLTELTKAAELSNKRKGAAEHLHSKSSANASGLHPHLPFLSTVENLSNGKGRVAATEQVQPPKPPKPVLPPVVDYRDPGVEYRSPPRTKSDNPLTPLPDKQPAIRAAPHRDDDIV